MNAKRQPPRQRRPLWTAWLIRLVLLIGLDASMRAEASFPRPHVSQSSPTAAAALTTTDAAALLVAPAPTVSADVELTEPPRFDLGEVVLIESELEHEDRFGLGPLDLLGSAPLRGPPSSYPETRVGGFELLPPFRVGASPTLSLWSHQACGFSCGEVVSDSRYDPWGLVSMAFDNPYRPTEALDAMPGLGFEPVQVPAASIPTVVEAPPNPCAPHPSPCMGPANPVGRTVDGRFRDGLGNVPGEAVIGPAHELPSDDERRVWEIETLMNLASLKAAAPKRTTAMGRRGTGPKGSRNPVTRASAEVGQEAHRQKEFDYRGRGYKTEVTIKLDDGSVVRKDAMKGNETVIIKPDTDSGRAAASKRESLMRRNGFDPAVDLYDPKDPRYQPGSPTYIGPGKKP